MEFMDYLAIFLIVYGVFCIAIGILKLPAIWKMKKFQVMMKVFRGERNLQIFVIVWGLIALIIGINLR